jgi:hypothetical protein
MDGSAVHGALLCGAEPADGDAAGPAHGGGSADAHVVVGAELARRVLVDAPDRHAAAPDGYGDAGGRLALRQGAERAR